MKRRLTYSFSFVNTSTKTLGKFWKMLLFFKPYSHFFVNSEQLNVIICIIHKQRDISFETIKRIVTNLSNISETSFSNKILEQQASYENKTRLTQLQVEILWQTFSH